VHCANRMHGSVTVWLPE